MAWINVNQILSGGSIVPNVVNIDAMVRIGRNKGGCYIRFLDGSSIDVSDSYEEMTDVLQKLAGREASV